MRDGAANRQEVQIFDADRKHVYATILAVAAERRDMRSNTEMRFVEQPKGQLKLVGWFYPNRLIGHEFAHNWRQTRRYANEDVITVMARPESGGRVIAQR